MPEETPKTPAAPPQQGEVTHNDAIDALIAVFGERIVSLPSVCKEAAAQVQSKDIIEVCSFLKKDEKTQMNLLSDLTAAHYPNREFQFEVIYHIYSIPRNMSIRVKVPIKDGDRCPSVTGVWQTANWHEREVFDMFGIIFEGHPDLRTILLPDNWDGNPLRKEYPLGGPKEEEIRADYYGRPGYMKEGQVIEAPYSGKTAVEKENGSNSRT